MDDTLAHAVCDDIGLASSEDPIARALDDDLNTPAALSTLYTIAAQLRRASTSHNRARLRRQLIYGLELLGLPTTLDALYQKKTSGTLDPTVTELQARRAMARRRKDYPEADRLRDLLRSHGVNIADSSSDTP